MKFTVSAIESPRHIGRYLCAIAECSHTATHTVTDRFGPTRSCDDHVAQMVREIMEVGMPVAALALPFAGVR
jgi:hypothetical protein